MSPQGRRLVGAAIALLAVLATAGTTGGVAGAAAPAAKPPAYEQTVTLTVADLQDYWSDELPQLYGVEYRRIPKTRIIPYTSTSKLPHCGPGKVRYKDVADNAFYCNAGKFVAYDDEGLFPDLAKHFGDFTIALTLAHEWGHAVQDQADLTGPTIALEQQADCFAGAWVRHVDDGQSSRLTLNQGNLDAGLAGYLTFRDPPGSDPTADGAHGSAFDRVGAFQEGYDGGPERCADFEDNPPELTDIPFTDPADLQRGGNLPFGQVIPETAKDLDAYWQGLLTNYQSVARIEPYDRDGKLPRCGKQTLTPDVGRIAYCPNDRTIYYQRQFLTGLYDASGDFGVAAVIGAEWAVAMQQDEGITGDPKAIELQQSCFTGSWAGDIVRGGHDPDGQGLTLSAGDLDEAIQSYLVFRDEGQIAAGTGATAFENVDAFRLGFFQGEQPCVGLVPS
jgi:predicted metalloprotease